MVGKIGCKVLEMVNASVQGCKDVGKIEMRCGGLDRAKTWVL